MSSTTSEHGDSLRVYGVVNDSIVDGPGLRFTVFTQGCPHRCPGCHNPESHDPSGGQPMRIDDLVAQIARNPLLSGITLSGGEPMEQPAACLALIKALPRTLTVWLYSGWTWQELTARNNPSERALLQACDVLVDGRYSEAERSLQLQFRGSRNQRLIDIQKTLAKGKGEPILWEPPTW